MRRDPSSPAFIDLGEAYLALGRPKDAISVGNVGIQAAPDSLEGRVMVARAHAQLHQWKEAQGELLRVVKVDRSSRQGFALLGEVLLRRQDYERAVPVLQHAQNLDPTSPQILAMLKRARANQSLDPPPPVPTPVPPRGETNYGLQLDPPPARSAPPPKAPSRPAPPPLSRRSAPMPAASPAMPTFAVQPEPSSALWGDPEPYAAPPSSQALQQPMPHASPEGVRPRVVSAARPQNAAQASLRQSAAVGENYLNELLTGGLLDVAGVRVPDADFDLRPDRRWGRSTRRAFIFLFVVLILGIGGGGGWYWWSEKQRALAVAGLQNDAKAALVFGDFAGLETSITKLGDAVKLDPNNLLSVAYAAEATGLEALLYGTDDGRVDKALKLGLHDIKDGEPGSRELMIGKAAVELSRLSRSEAAATTLAEVDKALDGYLAKHDTDLWARWLKGRALLAAGQRKAGQAEIKKASEGTDGLVVAMVDLADLLVDQGSLDDALALYDKALAKSKDHPLAVLGKSLARAESSVQASDAIGDLNVTLGKFDQVPRVFAYKNLALALADASIEEYSQSLDALHKAMAGKNPPAESRFLARVAWAHYARGELAEAANARKPIAWYGPKGSKAEDDPVVMLVDAALLLASGLPEKALDESSKISGVRPALLRAYADLDLDKPKDAINEATEIGKKAPDNVEAQVLQWATMVAAAADKNDKERSAAADALEKLARKTKSKLGRHALGMAYYMIGDNKNAQPQLEQAVADVSDDQPNPLSYRTRTALADILLAANDIPGAGKQLDEALKVNSGNFPALAMQANRSCSRTTIPIAHSICSRRS